MFPWLRAAIAGHRQLAGCFQKKPSANFMISVLELLVPAMEPSRSDVLVTTGSQ
jgi:hypothetical protein